jgi:crossover junction endodeoxyribonuclease RusA
VIELTVIGTPAPQGSKVRTRWGVRDDNPNTKPWRATVAAEAAEAMNGTGLISGPVAVEVTFVFARPKSHYGTGSRTDILKASAPFWHTVKPDGDKLARAVGDALTGQVLRDDSQVARWQIRKLYGDRAEARIRIFPLYAEITAA